MTPQMHPGTESRGQASFIACTWNMAVHCRTEHGARWPWSFVNHSPCKRMTVACGGTGWYRCCCTVISGNATHSPSARILPRPFASSRVSMFPLWSLRCWVRPTKTNPACFQWCQQPTGRQCCQLFLSYQVAQIIELPRIRWYSVLFRFSRLFWMGEYLPGMLRFLCVFPPSFGHSIWVCGMGSWLQVLVGSRSPVLGFG